MKNGVVYLNTNLNADEEVCSGNGGVRIKSANERTGNVEREGADDRWQIVVRCQNWYRCRSVPTQ